MMLIAEPSADCQSGIMLETSPPQVSIVVACYNAEPYLRDAMESVVGQTFADWELIVVNDGSTDGSLSFLHGLAGQDARVRVIDQDNHGQNAAANLAISIARAPLIARMDADDLCHPTRLEKQVAFMHRNPGVGLLGTQICRLGDCKSGLSSSFPTDHDGIVDALLQNHHAICNPTIIFRRELFEQIGGYWEHNIAEDWDMFLRMAEISRLANLDEVLFSYRFHRGSINGRRIVEAQLFNEYAAELWQLRRQNRDQISFEEFSTHHPSSNWPASWLFLLDCHSIGQYRQAVAEIYGGRQLRGTSRLALSMAMSPARTLRRATRMVSRAIMGSPEPVVYADPFNAAKLNAQCAAVDSLGSTNEADGSAASQPSHKIENCTEPGSSSRGHLSSSSDTNAHRANVPNLDT